METEIKRGPGRPRLESTPEPAQCYSYIQIHDACHIPGLPVMSNITTIGNKAVVGPPAADLIEDRGDGVGVKVTFNPCRAFPKGATFTIPWGNIGAANHIE